jgi:hypothetical protein
VTAIENIYATDELSVPLTILVDERGIVTDLIPGWSSETQRKFNRLTGESPIAPQISAKPEAKIK